MENSLQRLLNEKKEQELTNLNAVKIVGSLFDELQDREKDVLARRFALKSVDSQTLEEIGKLHNLTRERIRQIEKASLKKIKKINDIDSRLNPVREMVSELLKEHGGVMEKNFLLDILTVLYFKAESQGFTFDKNIYKNYLDFILTELLNDSVEKVDKSDKFNSFFKLKDQTVDYLENLVDELRDKVRELKKTFSFDELVDMAKNLKSFSEYKNKMAKSNDDLDLKEIFKDESFPEWADVINRNKQFYSFMQAAKDLNPNKFGLWGDSNSSEIKPKRIADKIFLVLKEEKKPLHFSEIAEKINKVGFDKKSISKGSVHNELILDDRYILVDRGVYGLKEWQK